MRLIRFSIDRPVTVTMLMVAAVVFGWVSFDRLPLDLLPDITYPTLTVRTEFPGAAPAEVEQLVSKRIEEDVGIVNDVVRVGSISRPERSDVSIEFAWGTNMDFASMDVREKLDLFNVRQAEKPVLLRYDPSMEPIMRLSLSGGQSLTHLRWIAEEEIKPDLESLEGVAAAQISGGLEEEIVVFLDPLRLSARNLSIKGVATRLSEENINIASGTLQGSETQYLVRTLNEFESLDDIRRMVVAVKDGAPVYLKDVGRVERSYKDRTVVARVGGQEAIEVAVFKEAGSNTVAVAALVLEALPEVELRMQGMAPGAKIDVLSDQSTFINQSVNAVLSTAVVGGILAILVLYLFLNNLKSTIIIGLAIPISVVSTFFWMYLFGVSLNIMSLGGLALGIGMLVDSAIVVLEAIDRRRKEGLGQAEAAYEGASEVGQAVIASTMTTVCVFAPIIFVEGIAGQLFADLALTVTFSLLVALAVAVTLIPMLASLTLDEGDPETNRAVIVTASTIRRASWAVLAIGFFGRTAITPIRWVFDRWFGWVQRIYPNLLNTAIERRVVMSLGAVGVFGVSLLATRGLGVELIPELSQGELLVSVELAAGASLSRTDRTLRDMTDRISDMPQIAQIYSVAGAQGQSSGAATDEQEHVGQISMRLTDEATREIEDALIDTLGQKFRDVPGMTYRFSRPTLFSFRTPIEVEVYGEDLSLLASISDMLSAKMKDIPGLFDVASTQASGTPELQVTFNRDRLAAANSSVSAVAGVIRAEVEGEIATEFVEGDRNIDIRVRAAADSRTGVQTLSQIIINPTKDIPIPLSAVAYIHESIGPTEIRRIDQQRVALVTSNVRGRDLGAVAEDIQLAIEESNLPLGVGAVVAGQRAEMETSFDSMRFAGALAVFLVYLVMASQFESLVHPFVVMFTMPFGAIGVIAALLLTGTTVNVIALIGAIMLAGIVVNNAIVLIDAINQGRASGLSVDDAVRRGGAIRLRPILMTTATTVLGLLPMSLGVGEGAEVRAPMAITVIGGLLIGTVLTLVLLPTVYRLVEGRGAQKES